jgi:glycosyltransferase involved in cell wall biosynthesis
MVKVCHLTSVHPRFDPRIFYKECLSLAENGYKVVLAVRDSREDEEYQGIKIINVGPICSNRFFRIISNFYYILTNETIKNSDIIHIHDPELLPVGLLLRYLWKKIIIYDMHEDLPGQILEKDYLPRYLRPILSQISKIIVHSCIRYYDGVISAADFLTSESARYCEKSITIWNFPRVSQIKSKTNFSEARIINILFIGNAYHGRSLEELAEALKAERLRGKMTLTIIGTFDSKFYKKMMSINNQDVRMISEIKYEDLSNMIKDYDIGFVCDYGYNRNQYEIPTKLLEYAAAGLCVLAQNTPTVMTLVEESKIGICVEPGNTNDILKALLYLQNNKESICEFGKAGIQAVKHKYSWEAQEPKLLDFYKKICHLQ